MNSSCSRGRASGRRNGFLPFHDDANLRTVATDNADIVASMIGFILKFQVERQRSLLHEDEFRAAHRTIADDAVG
ncbi:MAG: hypothetical protein H6R00_958 [Proteobacteria bacterium]|nr:hypothetical protein [Pseudomonadota bacterium]